MCTGCTFGIDLNGGSLNLVTENRHFLRGRPRRCKGRRKVPGHGLKSESSCDSPIEALATAPRGA